MVVGELVVDQLEEDVEEVLVEEKSRTFSHTLFALKVARGAFGRNLRIPRQSVSVGGVVG